MGPSLRTSQLCGDSLAVFLFAVLLSPPLLAQQLSSQLLHGLEWRLIGPHRGGRVTAVAGIAGDPQTYYMGTPGGGVWKTTNAGRTWFPVFDQAHLASIGDLAVAPSNPDIIFVATGEQTNGDGVWKSTDAGATWSNVGLRDARKILSLLVDPHDANSVYVAAMGDSRPGGARGIFKSVDGGTSWRKVFSKDEGWNPYELDFDPDNPHTIVAAVIHTPLGPGEKPEGGVDTLLLKTTDSGETWVPMGEQGLPSANRGRVGLSIAPGSAGKRIFALMARGLFRSDDSGSTWQKITADPRVIGNEYFCRVYADPRNPEVVYVMQTSTYRSSDGGRTFVAWKGTPSGEDDHVLWIAPNDSNRIFMGTDQGAVITFDGGKSWTSWFNQPTGQFYRVSTDNSFPYHVYAAQQDSGSIVVPNRSDFGLITYRDWFSSGSFESSFIAPDPVNPQLVYSGGWYGTVVRLDRSTGQVATVFLSPSNYRSGWETPITFSPRDPHALFFGSQFLVKTTDGAHTWKEISPDLTAQPSAAQTDNAEAGRAPCNDHFPLLELLGGREAGRPNRNLPFIQAIAPSPLDANLIWVGTSNGIIQVTHDSSTWSNVTPTGLPERSVVNSIDPSLHDANTAFATAIACDDLHPYVFRTTNGGKSWEKLVQGLPESGVARVVREDPVRKGLLFAGTENGVYVSLDSGSRWQPLQLNLPTASVTDLAIHGDDLVAATYGRGLWILDDISPLRQLDDSLLRSAARLLVPQTAIRAHWDNHPDTPLQPDAPVSQNPPDGAILYYYLSSPPKGEITLEVLDEKGARMRWFSSNPAKESYLPANVPEFWFAPPTSLPAAAGVNRFVWDLRFPPPTALPYGFYGEYLAYVEYDLPDHAVPGETPRAQPPGPVVPPGTYELVLTVEGKFYRQKLRIVPDPRVHLPSGEFAAQFELSRRIWVLMNASAVSFESVLPLQTQLAERQRSLPANASRELSEALEEAGKQLDRLVYGSEHAPGFGTLNRNLARYLVMVQSADIAPSDSIRESYQSACDAYAKNVSATNKLTNETLPALSKQLASEKLAPMEHRTPQVPIAACTR